MKLLEVLKDVQIRKHLETMIYRRNEMFFSI